MCERYARSLLRVSVAQMCQAVGWDAVQLSACDLLSDVLERYVQQLVRSCHRYSELYGRTDPGLSDVDQAFGFLGVSIAELEDYVNNLEPVGFPQTIPQFPISKSSVLQFPAAGFDTDARDALRGERRDYIPKYFPPLVSLQEDEEEEEPVPPDMGTSAEAMQVSLGEEEDGEEEENDENWLSHPEGQSPRPEGLLPAAKRPRLSTKPGVSPEWSNEPREPLTSLNSQHMPHSPSPPLSPELPRPPVAPPTPGHKPKLPSPSPARQKNKLPKRAGGSASAGVLGRPLILTPPKTNQKSDKRSPARPKSPRSPKPSPALLGAVGRGWGIPPGEDSSLDGQSRGQDTGDEDIENSIAAVIARACAGEDGTSDPFAYDSDSDSDEPNPSKPVPKHALTNIKPPQTLPGKQPPPPVPQHLSPPNRWTMDDSIDEVIRQANQIQKPIQAPSLSPPDPDSYLSSPSDSPPTPPPPLKPPQERKDPTADVPLKKKLKKDIKAKLKKKDKERLKEKGKDKGKNKEKNKEKKREKERGQVEENRIHWPELSLGVEERRDGIGGKKEKDKHKDKKKDKEKSKKDKEKRDKGKERSKEEKKISQGAKDIAAASTLFSPQTCLRIPSMLPPLPPILPDKLFPHPKDAKTKEKDKKKEKKEKKKKKEKEKDREKEREKERERERERAREKERDKEEKKKEKEKKEKTKEKPKLEKTSLMADVSSAVPPSPVIPRLTLRVGAGQDKIVISKVVPDSEPTPPPPRTPMAKSGPGARMRSPPAPPPPAPTPVVPPPRPPPVLPPPTPPTPIQPSPSQAKARGCSVVTETVSAYVIRDEWGNQIWICPGCNKPDDGSPMIGCDVCDDWYHWPCVGLVAAPPEDQSWFCVKCAGKKKDKKTKKRKRKAH
ncbi:Transcription initiation factor TFIID subunit 3 TBP-associated factor 3 [Triplophysa tibetana]|uniref:Transcription initiation factor TFIID subunit 3 n=1 Tax=Triplophysa tibetana TaxID=1572043 RepID=A0A5A9PHR3_9TELE|nr:Transcription initiation factor TFIID subunit 3 TBP-associated factor 3 [Triplophysa tibetana]